MSWEHLTTLYQAGIVNPPEEGLREETSLGIRDTCLIEELRGEQKLPIDRGRYTKGWRQEKAAWSHRTGTKAVVVGSVRAEVMPSHWLSGTTESVELPLDHIFPGIFLSSSQIFLYPPAISHVPLPSSFEISIPLPPTLRCPYNLAVKASIFHVDIEPSTEVGPSEVYYL